MRRFLRWLVWRWRGRPIVHYVGYNCGCCGAWVAEPFTVPKYESAGQWWDTWGLCSTCEDGDTDA